MAKRKAISKKTRFEVFKRDRFTCTYCGRKAPDVILEVDHIVPVAEGGKNDLMNLVTSCRECNRGKGKRKLSDDSAIEKQRAALEDAQERREQMEMMLQWQRDLKDYEDKLVDFVEEILTEPYNEGYRLKMEWRMLIKRHIHNFGLEDVVQAAYIARERYVNEDDLKRGYWYSVTIAVKKIGGICYNWQVGRTAEDYVK